MARTVLKFATTLSRTASGAANHPSGKKLFIRLFPIFVMAALYRYLSFILNHVTTRAAVFWWTSGACPAFLQRIPPKREISWPDQFFINERPSSGEFSRDVREIRPVATAVFLYYRTRERRAPVFIGSIKSSSPT